MSGLWPPCFTQSRNKIFPALEIISANGGWLQTKEQKIFDATSSWWCKHLGHRHPAILTAIAKQTDNYIHAIGANTYSHAIKELSNKLTSIFPELDKVSYASDGSCAVEIAIKMSLHTRKLIYPNDKRSKIIKLSGAYHGETSLALAVSDCDLYKSPYKELLIETHTCPIPSCIGTHDMAWHNADSAWQQLLPTLESLKDSSAILIIEPLLQAANCMKIYSADLMLKLLNWAKVNNIDTIADEIMTGFWRTGKLFAIDYINFVPDFICLGKGLTAGSIPMSAVLSSSKRFLACYPKHGKEQPFLHSHTYSAHALAAATANAALDIYLQPETAEHVAILSEKLLSGMQSLAKHHLINTRGLGCVVAAELNPQYFEKLPQPAELQKIAARHGLLIRPLAQTIYLCPPINTSLEELEFIFKALDQTLRLV